MSLFLNDNYKNWRPGAGTILSLDTENVRFDRHSVRWEWRADTSLNIPFPRGSFKRPDPRLYGKAHPTFSLWVFNDGAIPDKLLFEFGKGDEVCCSFEYRLDFTGWRTGWLSFLRDMNGTADDDMDFLRISAPSTVEHGVVCFDQMILCSFMDPRYHMRDFQLPQINPAADVKVNRYWLGLYGFSRLAPVPARQLHIPIETFEVIEGIEKKLLDYYLEEYERFPFNDPEDLIRDLGLTETETGFKGPPPVFDAGLDIYPLDLRERYREQLVHNSFAKYCCCLWSLACHIKTSTDKKSVSRSEELLIKLLKFMQLHGWAEGSGMGTLHHLGYAMRELTPALLLVKGLLRRKKQLKPVTAMLRWLSGTGRIYAYQYMHPGVDMDTLATQCLPILGSILLNDEARDKVRDLTALSQWLGKALDCAPGLLGTFKVDGAMFHHYNHKPADAANALQGCLPLLYVLAGTPFAVTSRTMEVVGRAVMTGRYYANTKAMPMSLAAGDVRGYQNIDVDSFYYLYLALREVMPERAGKAASAYLRLTSEGATPRQQTRHDLLLAGGYLAEAVPAGHWNINYGAMAMHRRGDWLATVRGHSRYLWRSESYTKANLFGRYTLFGQLEILPAAESLRSFRHDGWDWNHWPGITAQVKPVKLLYAELRNIDEASGFEEMLLSTESFAGGVNIDRRNGVFGLALRGHPKYEKPFRACKSWFFFDETIICLGSGIYSEDTQNPVHTTLFQTPLPENESAGFSGPGLCGHNFNVARIDSCGNKTTWLADSAGNGYYIPAGEFSLTFGEQTSVDQCDGSYTSGRFSRAWLDHGIGPDRSDYEYVVIPQGEKRMPEFVESMRGDKPPYAVLRKDDGAHIVRYRPGNFTGYVMFRSGIIDVDGEVAAVDGSCLLLTQRIGNRLKLSLCHPDLHLYDGDDKDQFNEKGQQVEVSIYSRLWAANASKAVKIRLRLNGAWQLVAGEHCNIIEKTAVGTLAEFTCCDALPIQVELCPE